MHDDDRPPPALQEAVDALAKAQHLHLTLAPAAYRHWWSILRYTDEGHVRVFLPAQEDGTLYATLTRLLRETPEA